MAEDELGQGWVHLEREQPSGWATALMDASEWLDRRVGWHRLPLPLGIGALAGIRDRLRESNLFDPGVPERSGTPSPDQRAYRTAEGTWNDLAHPAMGSAGTRFGRNVDPFAHMPETAPTLLTPDPRVVSRTLLTRDQFVAATSINVLAAAWIQFEVHDWFSHGKNQVEEPYRFPRQAGDTWPDPEIVIERTKAPDAPGRYASDDTHWWDGSQIYGSSAAEQALLRDGAKLRIEDGTIPAAIVDHLDFTGQQAGFWTGWAMLHSLFALEHNHIVDHLRAEEKRAWTDDELFNTARLVNVALMAKIHTTEWTPAIIAHPTTRRGMSLNWWGISERLRRSFGRISTNEVISGIPGSPRRHHGAPYCLTEEFVAVYRMHPLVPDEFVFRAPGGGDPAGLELGFADLRTRAAIPRLRELGMPSVLYTFGTSHPGAITLHNFPRSLQQLDREGQPLDLAAIDVFRNRERGVPRYNRFRQAFHKPAVRSFDQLTSNPAWADEIRQVYDGDIEAVDLLIGLFAEDLPPGFGFSDTAFRVFILMASRRLKSDRFFTDHYDAEHYTQTGLRYVDDNTMKTVLLHHYPELAPALGPVENAFAPWARVAG